VEGAEREAIEMNLKGPCMTSWVRISIGCLPFFLLFILFCSGTYTACTEEAGQPLSRISSSHSSADEEAKKEGDMVDTDKLTEEEGEYLLSVARQTIEERFTEQQGEGQPEALHSPKFSENRGTFVTLTKNGALRGCIGHIIPQESMIEGIKENAINAAFRDPRFPPLSEAEWKRVQVEISILTDPTPLVYEDSVDLLNKLRPGIDGLIIKKGFNQATFLPQVWEQLPDRKEFLRHLCLKAGLDRDAWKHEKLEVFVYQVQAFEEH
jgi:AmmeMemoRadiSam system protein A